MGPLGVTKLQSLFVISAVRWTVCSRAEGGIGFPVSHAVGPRRFPAVDLFTALCDWAAVALRFNPNAETRTQQRVLLRDGRMVFMTSDAFDMLYNCRVEMVS